MVTKLSTPARRSATRRPKIPKGFRARRRGARVALRKGMDNSFTKSIELQTVITPDRSVLRMIVQLRRLAPALGFAAGFAGCMGLLSLVNSVGPSEAAARAYPNPAPNAAITAPPAPQVAAIPQFPNPRHQ